MIEGPGDFKLEGSKKEDKKSKDKKKGKNDEEKGIKDWSAKYQEPVPISGGIEEAYNPDPLPNTK